MDNQNKCDKYEAFFVFKDEEVFLNHIKECPDCQKEHEKQLKISQMVKEVAPLYLEKKRKEKASIIKKLACCFVFFIGLSAFGGYKYFDEYNYLNADEDSYISTMGLPVDEYGFLEI